MLCLFELEVATGIFFHIVTYIWV